MLLSATNSVDSSYSQQHLEVDDISSQALDWDDLEDVLHQRIAYSPILATIGGSVQAGIFLSQAYYWTERTRDPDGWFYKTKDDWFDETKLTRRQLDTVVERLVQKGLISTKYDATRHTLYYRLNKDAVTDAVAHLLESSLEEESPKTPRNTHKNARRSAQKRLGARAKTPRGTHKNANPDNPQNQSQQPFQGSPYNTHENKQENTQTQDNPAPPNGAPAPHPSVCVNNNSSKENNQQPKDLTNSPVNSLPEKPKVVQNYSNTNNQNQNSSTDNKSNHQDKNSAPGSVVRINRNNKANNAQRITWQCPQPELESEFYEWRGQLMVESGFVKTPSTKVIAAKAWSRNHPEDATELFNNEFLKKRNAMLSVQEREEAKLAQLRQDHENRINGMTKDGKPAAPIPPGILERIRNAANQTKN
ncbi:hypothetical protein CAL7716_103960 (plasmid) [Calothrix sp. PCC 7716]|nr:hypothetical protein CAL7716_103960 [Calothrix sp. PCC 7716]